MGCVASKLDINDVHPNIFAVNNVDDMGTKLSSGQLEITDADLILYQKGKQPIKWPLKYLKRYGFEAGLFSFEAGRKTPTGPGVYAFKCRRAEKLFNLLQVRVREQGPDRSSLSLAPLAGLQGGEGTDTAAQSPVSPLTAATLDPGSPAFSFPDSQDVSTASVSAAYINCTVGSPGPGYLNITQELANTETHEYENIGPDTPGAQSPGYVPPRAVFSLPPKPQHLQQPNSVIDTNHDQEEEAEAAEDGAEDGGGEDSGVASINYIVLDLDPASTASEAGTAAPAAKLAEAAATSQDAATRTRGYVTIDFDKTDALIKSANHRYFEDDPGVRKTRHNSSLSELGPPGKLS